MNDDLMGGGPFVPFDPPYNPQQDQIRRMMAEKLMQLPSNDQLDQMEAQQREFERRFNARPDGTVGSRNFQEALTPMARSFDNLAPERQVAGPGMGDVANAGSVTPEDLNRQRMMAQQVMKNYAPPMRRPMR